MGVLQDFANAQAVNEALKKGVAAHEGIGTLETDISSLKGTKINGTAVTGELDSQTDLKIAGKVTAEGGVVMNGAIGAVSGAVAMGGGCTASGGNSVAMGGGCTASGGNSVAMGGGCKAEKSGDVAMGNGCTASGGYSVAMGVSCTASGGNSVAMGSSCRTEKSGDVAMGNGCTASGGYSVAMGGGCKAEKSGDVAMGSGCTASGGSSVAMGGGCTASSNCQHVIGKYNTEDSSDKFAFIIGNGDYSTRSNAIAIDWDGKIYVGNSDTGIDLNDLLNRIIALENA